MSVNEKLLTPCGLYCGVCAIHVAHRQNHVTLKEKLARVYGVTPEQIACEGCGSASPFGYCAVCEIAACAKERELDGCHECADFPCERVDNFPFEEGKKVMLRAVPARREMGIEAWVAAETKRYQCPSCGGPLLRGFSRCGSCKQPVSPE
jgi:Protein of unknown function (DUF3795)